jgi:hypothetical protein
MMSSIPSKLGEPGETGTDLVFAMALGLSQPWRVEDVRFDAAKGQLDIDIDFDRGAMFTCPECGASGCKAWDTENKSWRHLNFSTPM